MEGKCQILSSAGFAKFSSGSGVISNLDFRLDSVGDRPEIRIRLHFLAIGRMV